MDLPVLVLVISFIVLLVLNVPVAFCMGISTVLAFLTMPGDLPAFVAVAHKIVERAEAVGIPREDVVIDCLTLAVGADTSAGLAANETAERVTAELGVNLLLAASNVSFGLPDRPLLNSAFVAIAIAAGVDCLIVDAAKVRPAVLAADLVLDRDKRARRYVEAYRQRMPQG